MKFRYLVIGQVFLLTVIFALGPDESFWMILLNGLLILLIIDVVSLIGAYQGEKRIGHRNLTSFISFVKEKW